MILYVLICFVRTHTHTYMPRPQAHSKIEWAWGQGYTHVHTLVHSHVHTHYSHQSLHFAPLNSKQVRSFTTIWILVKHLFLVIVQAHVHLPISQATRQSLHHGVILRVQMALIVLYTHTHTHTCTHTRMHTHTHTHLLGNEGFFKASGTLSCPSWPFHKNRCRLSQDVQVG